MIELLRKHLAAVQASDFDAVEADLAPGFEFEGVAIGRRGHRDEYLAQARKWMAAYPDLKASATYLELQRRISALEEQIAHRREYYNAAVNLNNVRMEQFPDSLLASIAGLRRASLFAATAEEIADIDVGGRLRT